MRKLWPGSPFSPHLLLFQRMKCLFSSWRSVSHPSPLTTVCWFPLGCGFIIYSLIYSVGGHWLPLPGTVLWGRREAIDTMQGDRRSCSVSFPCLPPFGCQWLLPSSQHAYTLLSQYTFSCDNGTIISLPCLPPTLLYFFSSLLIQASLGVVLHSLPALPHLPFT